MTWIYISPHFDDVALSCGGLVWEQSQAGEKVGIWTICGGKPQKDVRSPLIDELHARWGTGTKAVEIRLQEDIRSCAMLSAAYHHFDVPDCIYRVDNRGNALYASEEALFGDLNDLESELVDKLCCEIESFLEEDSQVVCPLAVGRHVDHQLTRKVIEQTGKASWYYADYPYLLKTPNLYGDLQIQGWKSKTFPVSNNGLQAWVQGVKAHRSQLSTFWENEREIGKAYEDFLRFYHGIVLWSHP